MSKSKQIARELLQERYDALSVEEYSTRSHAALARLFESVSKLRPEKVLLYQARHEWREVAVTDVREVLPGAKCDITGQSKNTPVPTEQYDIIIVPLYGFTDELYRLGHGNGWYDKLLAGQPQAFAIGVGLEVGLIEFEYEPHDVRLNCIVTDAQVRYITP